MSTQQQIKSRLSSAKNILHITQAMEVVSGVRLRKLMHKRDQFQFYAEKLEGVVEELKAAGADETHPLFKVRPVKKTCVLIVGGDKGLCGAYNDQLLKAAKHFLAAYEKNQVELVLIGNKAVDAFSPKEWGVRQATHEFARHLTEANVRAWSKQYIDAFLAAEFDELFVVYTEFENVMRRIPKVKRLLPLVQEKKQGAKTHPNFLYEPDAKTLYDHLIPTFVYVHLQAMLYSAYASELSSRLIAMKAAGKNAEEMIERLTLLKNKNRQLAITREILEITAGAEGLK